MYVYFHNLETPELKELVKDSPLEDNGFVSDNNCVTLKTIVRRLFNTSTTHPLKDKVTLKDVGEIYVDYASLVRILADYCSISNNLQVIETVFDGHTTSKLGIFKYSLVGYRNHDLIYSVYSKGLDTISDSTLDAEMLFLYTINGQIEKKVVSNFNGDVLEDISGTMLESTEIDLSSSSMYNWSQCLVTAHARPRGGGTVNNNNNTTRPAHGQIINSPTVKSSREFSTLYPYSTKYTCDFTIIYVSRFSYTSTTNSS
jgi:hypothetical protein